MTKLFTKLIRVLGYNYNHYLRDLGRLLCHLVVYHLSHHLSHQILLKFINLENEWKKLQKALIKNLAKKYLWKKLPPRPPLSPPRPPRNPPPRPPKMYHHIISFYTDSHFTIFTLLFSLKETYHGLLEVWILVFPFFNLVFYVLTYIRLNFNLKYFFLQEMLLLKNVFLFWCDHHVQSAASVSQWPISK